MTEPPNPQQVLMHMLCGKFVSQSLGVVAELGVADLLRDGPRGASELARETGSHPDALYRVLRALASLGVFAEGPGRTFALTPLSQILRGDAPGSMRAMARWLGADPEGWRAWGGLRHSVKTGAAAFEEVVGKNVFEYFADNAAAGAVFDAAMTSFSGIAARAVAEAYDFSPIGTLVDVGGGQGALLAAVCERHPTVRGVDFDLPHVIERARAFFAEAGREGLLEFVAGDFLEGVPGGADAYMMKHIIHDWGDDVSVKILANCRKAVKPGGRVLVLEQLITDRPEAGLAKLIDLEMLVMGPGRERTVEEFAALFERAGLRLERAVPTKSPVSVLEGVPA